MTDQLPTPAIELLLLQVFLGSLTFLGIVLGLAWRMKKQKQFIWRSYVWMFLATFVFGNALALFIWGNWPFSFDIMFGPIYLPGLVSYSSTAILIYLVLGYSSNFKK